MQYQFARFSGRSAVSRLLMCSAVALALSACDENGQFNLGAKPAEEGATEGSAKSVKLVERDVEAPEVFQSNDSGLWDGRPSLGGVWVAHPDVTDPERVIIRNSTNDKFVIGALFRKDRTMPGPKLQVSSDAAAALGMLAGQPVQLNVTALRRESVPDPAAAPAQDAIDAPSEVSEAPLDTVDVAAAAIDAAPATPAPAAAPAAAAPAPKPAAKKASGGVSKPYVQIGIFSVEQNANNTAEAMRQAGMIPTVKKQNSQGKTFWRVLVGPAGNKSELNALMSTIKGKGFKDAYAVSN